MRGRSLLLLIVVAAPLPAQVVRGRVLEASSQAPVVGALVTLLGPRSDSTLVSALTTASGEYAIRAPDAGTYRLAVKRIGVQRSVSAPFVLGPGETRTVDVPIAAVALTLPMVNVSALCAVRPRELGRIAALWEEARTALEATEITIRDRLMVARITRYAAEVDRGTLRVLFDWRSEAQVMTSQPFESPSGETLSESGYWREISDDSVVYLAPDAGALLSNAFIRDHCFSLTRTPRGRPDLVGLGFSPARDRTLPDISGTIWLDAKGFDLRFIEFRYTRLPDIPNAERVGGEVHYARLASGAWIVDRWFIRTPQYVVVPDAIRRRLQLYEVGGAVETEDAVGAVVPARVTGVVRDSSGRPVPGAIVRAIGTQRQATTDTNGAYTLDGLPAGALSIVTHVDGYDAFAVLAASRRVVTQPGRSQLLDLRLRDSGDIRGEVCSDPDLRFIQRARSRGALRIVMVDSATFVPMPGVRFVATWPRRWDFLDATGDELVSKQVVTDARGAATFCDLPVGDTRSIDVSVLQGEDARVPVLKVLVRADGIMRHLLVGRSTPRP
jgi:hypothetical protein